MEPTEVSSCSPVEESPQIKGLQVVWGGGLAPCVTHSHIWREGLRGGRGGRAMGLESAGSQRWWDGISPALPPGSGWELGACPRGAQMAIAKIWQKERVEEKSNSAAREIKKSLRLSDKCSKGFKGCESCGKNPSKT